jgi:hypothetical protein
VKAIRVAVTTDRVGSAFSMWTFCGSVSPHQTLAALA